MDIQMSLILFISLMSLIPFILHLILFLKKSRLANNNTYGFKSYPLVGNLPDFIRNSHRLYDYFTEALIESPTKTAVLHLPGSVPGVVTANPQVVEHMLRTNFDNYAKGDVWISIFHDFLGSGIFNSDGDEWKLQRKIANQEFNAKTFKNFAVQCASTELQTRLIPLLENEQKTGGATLDLQDVLERFAFDTICKVAFNYDPGSLDQKPGKPLITDKGDFMRAFDDSSSITINRLVSPFPVFYKIKKLLNLGSEKKLRESIRIIDDLAHKIIKTRLGLRDDENKRVDLLSRFIENPENPNRLSTKFLRDIIISFILAGRDTTSSTLSWFFWLLSSRKDVEAKILQELETIRITHKKSIDDTSYTIDELREMHYLHAAISESMRLYPAVPINTRSCTNEIVLPDGTFVGKNWPVTYLPYGMARMEDIWGKDCCEYKPERWIESDGTCKQESAIKYPIFHAGPRICLGRDMAYNQMKLVIACVLQRFEFDVMVEKDKCPEYSLTMTLKMKNGLPVKVKERRR